MTPTACDVLVVGAGPTGLTLAAQLLARGVTTRILDRRAGPVTSSRAVGTQPRTLEMLDIMGIVDRFDAVGTPVQRVNVYSGARRLVRIDHAYGDSRHPHELQLPQRLTEQLLLGRVTELGGAVEHLEVVSFSDDGATVSATCRGSGGGDGGGGGEHTVTARYLVGCDGAHSEVRKQLGQPFVGSPYRWRFLVADARIDWSGKAEEVHVFTRPTGLPLACIPITSSLWRLSLPMPEGWHDDAPSTDLIRELVAQRSPVPLTVTEAHTVTSYTCQLRSASAFRQGRVFLAGDAAHVQSPIGGQGLNLGMQDASNLSWKLALVLAGRAGDALLDTYDRERRPAAAQSRAFAERLVGAVTRRGLRGALTRVVLPAFGLPAAQRRLAGRLSQTAGAYRDGAHVGTAGRGVQLRPGARCPDLAVATPAGPTRLYAELRAGRHVLVLARDTPSDAPCGYALADDPDEVSALLQVVTSSDPRCRADLLVRPDGHIAARAHRGDPGDIRGYLDRYLTPEPSGAGEAPARDL